MRTTAFFILSILFCLKISAQGDIKLIFAGEVNLGNNYNSRKQSHSNVNSENLFINVRDELKSGSLTFATLGTSFIDDDSSPNKANMVVGHSLIRVPQSWGATLNKVGFNVLSLANLHVADFGIDGLHTTSKTLRENKIEHAGIKAVKEYSIFEQNNLRYGFVAFGTSVHAPQMGDSSMIRRVIYALNEQCDIVVVSFSFNENMSQLNSGQLFFGGQNLFLKKAQTFAHTCINMGADVVYGNGINLPQPIELYKDRLILYGLGNFCTPYGVSYSGDMRAAPVIEANLYSDGTFANGRIISYKQTNNQGPHLDNSHDALRLIKSLTKHNFPKTHLTINDNGVITSTSESSYLQAMKMLSEAKKHQGKPYRMGAVGPNVFDCSGFTSYVYAKIGIKLLRTASAQYTMGVPVERHSLQPGDLVFFTRSSVRGVGHVGIVYSVDKKTGSFNFIHASVSKGITIDNFSKSGYYIRRYVGARRIL